MSKPLLHKQGPAASQPGSPSVVQGRPLLTRFLLVCCVLLSLAACEDTVDPILESDTDFTLFGTLDMAQDTQFVRVIPIRESLFPDNTGPLDVVFTSEDLVTGEQVVWRDSIVTFSSGATGHVFYAPLRIRPSHTYRIEIRPNGSDVVTRAETTVPDQPDIDVQPPNITGGVGGAIGTGTQTIQWSGLSQEPFRIELWYRFLTSEGTPFSDILMPYAPQTNMVNSELDMMLNLTQDRRTLDTLVAVSSTALVGIGVELTVLDNAFVPPGGVFDIEVLVQPGTLSNVENGLGFVGSVGRFPVEWVLTNDEAHRLNYVTLEDIFGEPAPTVIARLQREGILPRPRTRYHPGVQ